MRLISAVFVLLVGTGISRADVGINVLLSGQVAPGVYGQVRLGNEAPPPLVYARPMLIDAMPAPPPPIYLHVPPGHARNWRRHCREYDACNRPVYFIRSEEYEPGFDRRRYEREHGHDQGRWHEGDQRGYREGDQRGYRDGPREGDQRGYREGPRGGDDSRDRERPRDDREHGGGRERGGDGHDTEPHDNH
ncbi:MAG: hypothetical protein M3N97_00175 [Pseudomonadota bacterium]|nr:hypothetical protein [Pseudomonadota bacterium]